MTCANAPGVSAAVENAFRGLECQGVPAQVRFFRLRCSGFGLFSRLRRWPMRLVWVTTRVVHIFRYFIGLKTALRYTKSQNRPGPGEFCRCQTSKQMGIHRQHHGAHGVAPGVDVVGRERAGHLAGREVLRAGLSAGYVCPDLLWAAKFSKRSVLMRESLQLAV